LIYSTALKALKSFHYYLCRLQSGGMGVFMKKSNILLSLLLALMFMFALGGAGASAATVGEQLLSPEDSWQRVDDTSSQFSYIGSWTSYDNNNYHYNSNYKVTKEIGSEVKFNFIGSALRIIATQDSANNVGGLHTVYIDGINCGIYKNQPKTTLLKCKLLFEKAELTYGEHYVRIVTEDYYNTNYGANWDCIDINDSGSIKPYDPFTGSTATNLTATAGDAQAALSWTAVDGATSYNIKRSLTTGGPYETVGSSVYAEYTDTELTNGTTYYYVVTAITASGESANSNEASVTSQQGVTPPTGNGTLIVTVANNEDREYNLTMSEIQAFINWYNNRSTGGNVYIIEKPAAGAYTRIKDYLIFDKIVAWEVKEY
jgi:hypothetical protein